MLENKTIKPLNYKELKPVLKLAHLLVCLTYFLFFIVIVAVITDVVFYNGDFFYRFPILDLLIPIALCSFFTALVISLVDPSHPLRIIGLRLFNYFRGSGKFINPEFNLLYKAGIFIIYCSLALYVLLFTISSLDFLLYMMRNLDMISYCGELGNLVIIRISYSVAWYSMGAAIVTIVIGDLYERTTTDNW